MNDQAMSPDRALTIAIKRTIDNDHAVGNAWPAEVIKPANAALITAELASRILMFLPEGWGLVDKSEIDDLDQRIREADATIRLLLAFKIEQDGYAPNLGTALKIADDRSQVHALYPEISE